MRAGRANEGERASGKGGGTRSDHACTLFTHVLEREYYYYWYISRARGRTPIRLQVCARWRMRARACTYVKVYFVILVSERMFGLGTGKRVRTRARLEIYAATAGRSGANAIMWSNNNMGLSMNYLRALLDAISIV